MKNVFESKRRLYLRRTQRSGKLYKEAKTLTPGGVHSSIRFFEPYPIFVEKGKGSKVWDVDGNQYIDNLLGYGPVIAGHSNPEIVAAVTEQVGKGTMYGMPHENTVKVMKELVKRYPMMDMFRFTSSGVEAIMHSLRVARAYTGRDKIVKIEGCYHGCSDYALISIHPPLDKAGPRDHPKVFRESMGVPLKTVENILVAPYNDIDAMEKILKENEGKVAGIILEPVMGTSGVILPKENYLENLRKLSKEHGALLIFDEIKTGCKVALGGVTELFGVNPDIVVLAKVIGGGLPLGAFGARKDIMEYIDPIGGTSHYGTYNANPIVVAASLACLTKVLTNQAYKHLNSLGEKLLDGIKDTIEDREIKAQASAIGSMGSILFTDEKVVDYRTAATSDKEAWSKYYFGMIVEGVIPGGGAWYDPWHLSVAHTKEEIDKTIEVLDSVFSWMKKLKRRNA